MNPKVDEYLVDGCGRCELYATPQCKVNNWKKELKQLRAIALDSGLKEDYKWSQPCYTYQGKNIMIVTALKDIAAMSFLKGALLKDDEGILSSPGPNSQSAKYARFTDVKDIVKYEHTLKAYIQEAIELEKQGARVAFKKNPEPMPEELEVKLDEDADFKAAFEALTPGRQRGYILHFSQPKKAETRYSRIEKYRQKILDGKGFHDR